MSLTTLMEPLLQLTCPPPGSVIVRRGQPVEGPGGRWIPCVTQSPGGPHLAGLFQVGQGCRQVSAADKPMRSAEDALALATELAATAAGPTVPSRDI